MDPSSWYDAHQGGSAHRRRFLEIMSGGLITITAGCSSVSDVVGDDGEDPGNPDSNSDSSTTDGGTDTSDTEDNSSDGDSDGSGSSDEAAVPTIEPQSFSGSGRETLSGVSIEGGPTVLSINYTGGGDFGATFRGEDVDVSFIDRRDSFTGDVADVVPAGEFELEVIATGEWEITVRQPRAAQGESLPASFETSGVDIVGPIQFSGTNTVTIEHTGDEMLILARLLMSSGGEQVRGEEVPIIVQGTGPFTVERTFRSDAVGWILSRGTGGWSVQIE